jgi:hypothetical protein
LTAGQAADVSEAAPLLAARPPGPWRPTKPDDDALIDTITARGAEAVIPPRANRGEQRHFDRHLY